jgi:hypothetical protein
MSPCHGVQCTGDDRPRWMSTGPGDGPSEQAPSAGDAISRCGRLTHRRFRLKSGSGGRDNRTTTMRRRRNSRSTAWWSVSGGYRHRGACIQGRPEGPTHLLLWGTVDDAIPSLWRRAKIMPDAASPDVFDMAMRSGSSLPSAAAHGCRRESAGRLRTPALIEWSVPRPADLDSAQRILI